MTLRRQVGQCPAVLAVGAGIVSVDILMLSVMSFKQTVNSQVPYHSIQVQGTTTGNLRASQFSHIF